MTCCIGPMLFIISNWFCMSISVNFPLSMLFMVLVATSSSITSSAFSIRLLMSPIPNNLEMNLSGSNASNSSILSPVPMNLIGAPVSATAERAPPPLAVPSNFEMIMEPISVACENALACSPACWPIVPSITRMDSSGSMILSNLFISSIKSSSFLCLPAVSKIMIFWFLNCFKPFSARSNASLLLGSP